jgi:hypothetical protein
MPLKYNNNQHRVYLRMIDHIGRMWLEVFGENTEFYSAQYWALFTTVWKSDAPIKKTDALRSITGVRSTHTAAKYLGSAIAQNLLFETDNPADARSKLVGLTPEMRGRLDAFFDQAVGELRRAMRAVDSNAPRAGNFEASRL